MCRTPEIFLRALCSALPGLLALGTTYAEALRPTWQETLLARRATLAEQTLDDKQGVQAMLSIHNDLRRDFPVETDWLSQDADRYELDGQGVPHNLAEFLRTGRDTALERKLVAGVLDALGEELVEERKVFERLQAEEVPAEDRRWLDLFVELRGQRRARRLAALAEEAPAVVFVKRHVVRPSFYGYTEGQSDAQHERHFHPGAALCLLHIGRDGCRVETLLDDPGGMIRDPDVSYDGRKVLFAWKKSDRGDDYHLYEMDTATRSVRTLTSGEGVADYDGCYLPNGDIMFSSTRCVQTVDCWWTEVSNMYLCDADGGKLRRVGFDQVHTVHPSVLNDGAVIYTRWDYNDRGQVFPQALFRMNPDGTGQTEYYGNNSYYPTVIGHARAIPGSDKLVAVLHGHHTWQAGELALIDRNRGTQEAEGVQLIAPVRETRAVRQDKLGQDRELFRHPYPLSEASFLVAMTPDRNARNNRQARFGLYWIDADGHRELLACDPGLSCNHPVPLQARTRPHVRPPVFDTAKEDGVYFLQDIHLGPGLQDVPRGTVKALRVVALEFRAAGVGNTRSQGEAGAALISTPIAVGNGAWDVKRILGQARVYEDGSALFKAPANTPVYFQALDEHGQVVQTMRSWSTLMPGETFSCVGCHEEKHAAPPPGKATLASLAGPQDLEPFYGPVRGFSFNREIQPILDRHCIECHRLDGNLADAQDPKASFSLKADPLEDRTAQRVWNRSYLVLTGAGDPGMESIQKAVGQADRPLLNWVSSQSRPSMLPPYHRGSAQSGMIRLLREGHFDVNLSKEDMDKLCAWIDLGVPFCGDYTEAGNWEPKHREFYRRYQEKRDRLAADLKH